MLIETADKSGFCFGVQRAIDLTGQAADKYGEVFTLGPLIHNTIVTDSLEKRGVHIAADVQDAQGKPLVIRSHGSAGIPRKGRRRYAPCCWTRPVRL